MATKKKVTTAVAPDAAAGITAAKRHPAAYAQTGTTEGAAPASCGAEEGAHEVQAEASLCAGRGRPRAVSRGLTQEFSTSELHHANRLRALVILERFRVIRTIDVAVACFAERPFKAALTAAQRVTRSLVKEQLIRRYKTERFQTVYGLTARGAAWLEENDQEATPSIRRVSDMTNPEHRLWLQFVVLCCSARGLKAVTESELLQALNRGQRKATEIRQGLLTVDAVHGQRVVKRLLRPDALAYEQDGATWFEVDRSKRGPERDASLAGLCCAIGVTLEPGVCLRRVVVLAKSERIEKRALSVVHELAKANNGEVLTGGRRHFRSTDHPGTFEVWGAVELKGRDGRTRLVDRALGHLIVQLIPTWLPKVRLDSRNRFPISGWLDDNFLPYRRPDSAKPWSRPHRLLPVKGSPST